jgi:hypothetical protein
MRKGHLCLLTVAMVIASIVIAGCATSDQANVRSSTQTNTSTTSTNTTTASSSVASASPTVTPSPRATPTATPTPSVSGTIATSIQFVRDPNVAKGTSLGINVIASGIRICGHGAVTATIGTVSSGGSSDCFYTAYLDTSGLSPGTYDVTLKFAGDSRYQPSQLTSKITIT